MRACKDLKGRRKLECFKKVIQDHRKATEEIQLCKIDAKRNLTKCVKKCGKEDVCAKRKCSNHGVCIFAETGVFVGCFLSRILSKKLLFFLSSSCKLNPLGSSWASR